jgi:hypothetical protein
MINKDNWSIDWVMRRILRRRCFDELRVTWRVVDKMDLVCCEQLYGKRWRNDEEVELLEDWWPRSAQRRSPLWNPLQCPVQMNWGRKVAIIRQWERDRMSQ